MLQEPSDRHTGPLEFPYGRGVNFEIGTPDVAALAEALRDGHSLRDGPTDSWRRTTEGTLSGSREIQVLDPDGYFQRFAEHLGTRSGVSE